MAKEATRQAIIQKGAKLIHSKGFVNTGIQEIITAAGVPKGSFYFYFKSKDDFGEAVIDYFCDFVVSWFEKYSEDHTLPPLTRLERFFDDSNLFYEKIGFTCGCPIGNLSQEMSDLSEPMRSKLSDAYGHIRSIIKNCIAEASEQGAVKSKEDAEELAVFVLNGWEGALIDMKVSKSIRPLVIFKKMLFEKILTT
ncbi:MAG: TetR family transcriptional regulator C-terminal domain-containing protein [Smithella sp.]